MTEEYAEKKGWFGGVVPVTVRIVCENELIAHVQRLSDYEPLKPLSVRHTHVEPYTADDLDELYRLRKK